MKEDEKDDRLSCCEVAVEVIQCRASRPEYEGNKHSCKTISFIYLGFCVNLPQVALRNNGLLPTLSTTAAAIKPTTSCNMSVVAPSPVKTARSVTYRDNCLATIDLELFVLVGHSDTLHNKGEIV